LLRRFSAASRHVIATFALGGVLALPLLMAAAPKIWVPLLPELPGPEAVAAPAASIPSRAKDGRTETASRTDEPAPLPAAAEFDGLPVSSSPSLSAAPDRAETPVRSAVPSTRRWRLSSGVAAGILAAWAAGFLISLARLAGGWLRIRGIERTAEPLCDREWLEAARELADRLGVPGRVRLVESPDVAVAMTAGVRRPVLLVHAGARKWAADRRRVVLLHELAHVRRRDWLTFVLAEIAVAVYWFHPLAWVARRVARTNAERACDDLVLENGTKPSVYAAHLLGIVRALKPGVGGALPVLAMARPSQFEDRMRAILNPGLQRRGPSRGQFRGAALGLFSAVLALAIVCPWARPAGAAALPGAVPIAADLTSSGEELAPHAKSPRECALAKGKARATMPLPAGGGLVKAIATEPAAPAMPPAAPPGIVLAGNGRHRSGGDWYSRGMDLHHDGRYAEAREAFEHAIAEGHREDAATYNIACGYALEGDRERAFEWLHRAAEAGFPLSRYLASDDDLDSLHSDPRFAALRRELNEKPSPHEMAERRSAVRRLEALAADSKSTGKEYYESGRQLLKAGDYPASAKAFHRAAELGHRPGTSFYNEACALSLAGEKVPALDALQRAIENGFDSPDMFRKDDDLDAVRGEARFGKLQALADELEMPVVSIGRKIFRSDERRAWREAADRAREVAGRHPELGRVWFALGYAEIRADRPEAAAEAFQKALDKGYRKPTTLYNLACSYAKLKQNDRAFDFLFRAIDAGFDENFTLRHDDDLDNLRGDARYRKALKLAETHQVDSQN
ncbi:MAG TPA: M56 family metallopeptidase, partial [Anaeromyxobacter sp.]